MTDERKRGLQLRETIHQANDDLHAVLGITNDDEQPSAVSLDMRAFFEATCDRVAFQDQQRIGFVLAHPIWQPDRTYQSDVVRRDFDGTRWLLYKAQRSVTNNIPPHQAHQNDWRPLAGQ